MNLSLSWAKLLKTLLKPQKISLLLSMIAGFFLLLSAYFTYKNIQKTLELGLKLQAQSIEATLQSLLKNFELSFILGHKDFLLDLLLNEKWEGVAFLTLFDYQRRILLHSNLELIGKKIEFSPFLQRGENISFLTLNTGERVFLYENKVKLKDSDGILRIALHIHPVSDSLYFARIHFYTEVIFAFLFFVFGLFSFLILDRLNRTKEKIEELEKWQRITQILIHEIKNPLASIKGFTQYLQRKITDHTQLKAAEIIYRESLRLERLIGSLSQFSYPFESKFTEVELISLIREVLASIQFLYPESIVHFDTQITEAKIRSDRDKFKSILINLLENAILASLEKGEKDVFLSLNEAGEYYILYIEDRGPGIDEASKRHIFEPFFTTRSKGMGLGLTIVKRFCEDLKLDFGLESRLNKGTVAWLKIPK